MLTPSQWNPKYGCKGTVTACFALIPKGPFRTKNATALESVACLPWPYSLWLSVPFFFFSPWENKHFWAVSVVFLISVPNLTARAEFTLRSFLVQKRPLGRSQYLFYSALRKPCAQSTVECQITSPFGAQPVLEWGIVDHLHLGLSARSPQKDSKGVLRACRPRGPGTSGDNRRWCFFSQVFRSFAPFSTLFWLFGPLGPRGPGNPFWDFFRTSGRKAQMTPVNGQRDQPVWESCNTLGWFSDVASGDFFCTGTF